MCEFKLPIQHNNNNSFDNNFLASNLQYFHLPKKTYSTFNVGAFIQIKINKRAWTSKKNTIRTCTNPITKVLPAAKDLANTKKNYEIQKLKNL